MIRIGIAIVCTLLVAVMGLAGFAIGTSAGASLLVEFAARRVPGELAVEDLTGSFLTGLRVARVR